MPTTPRPSTPAERTAPTPPSGDHEVTPGDIPAPESALEGLGKAITAPIRGAAEDDEEDPAA